MAELKKKKKHSLSDSSMVETPTAGDRVVDVIVYTVCALVALASVIPMWHVLMSSLSDGKTLLSHEGLVLWPVGKPTLDGFKLIFQNSGIMQGFMNSIIYTVATTACGFILAAITGYALSRKTKMKPIVTGMIMFTMLFSGGMVPTYMVIRALGWVGTRWALIIPGCTSASDNRSAINRVEFRLMMFSNSCFGRKGPTPAGMGLFSASDI